ncbi:hypothetical protein [Haloarchaeobius sp. FL176]|uniref:hypothetical protein n=1 Tax=Haloarchaeobius sp. FL176 TaxID=2967129 RepID=UPI002147C00B|nr:hypothetical protein [Haloarchaeobius sp. FL176]
MSRDQASVSRRKLLGSVGSVGALSGVAGAGTWALFEDSERFGVSMSAGKVGVSIDCRNCEVIDGTVGFEFGGLTLGEERTERFTVTADANPIWVWLRTNCPEPVDPLGDVVEIQLFRDPNCDGPSDVTQVYPPDDDEDSWTTLNEFRTALRGGLRLDDLDGEPCIDSELCLDLKYRLSKDATWAVDLSTELTFEVVAEQCRHVPESDMAMSPFPPEDCPEPECTECVELGKLEVGDDDLLEPDIYDFTELCSQFRNDETAYALEVLDAMNKDDNGGEETVCVWFRLLAGDSSDALDALDEANAPAMCSVAVKGSQQTESYPIDPPLTRTRGMVCTVTQDGDTGALPAISNIVVSVCAESDEGCGPPDGTGGPPRQIETWDQGFEVSD